MAHDISFFRDLVSSAIGNSIETGKDDSFDPAEFLPVRQTEKKLHIVCAPAIKPRAMAELKHDLAVNGLRFPRDYELFLYEMNGLHTPGLRFLGAHALSINRDKYLQQLEVSENRSLIDFNLELRCLFPDEMETRLAVGESEKGFFTFNFAAPRERACEEVTHDEFEVKKTFANFYGLLSSAIMATVNPLQSLRIN